MNESNRRTGDDDTDSILDEMEEEGEDLPQFAGGPDDSAADDADEEEEDEGEDEDDSDEEEDEEVDDSAVDDTEEDEGEDEDDEFESEEEPEEPKERTPAWKAYKETKKKLKAAEALIEQLKGSRSAEEVNNRIQSISAKHQIAPELAKDLLEAAADIAASKVGLDPQLKADMQRAARANRNQEMWNRQYRLFNQEFDTNVLPLIRQGNQRVNVEQVRSNIRSRFFSESARDRGLSQVQIYLGLQNGSKKVTSESAGRQGRRYRSVDLDDMETIVNLPDEEFDRISDELGRRAKSHITHRT